MVEEENNQLTHFQTSTNVENEQQGYQRSKD
jgi:hypothetical protein